MKKIAAGNQEKVAATTGCVLNQQRSEGDGEGDEGRGVEKRTRPTDDKDAAQGRKYKLCSASGCSDSQLDYR